MTQRAVMTPGNPKLSYRSSVAQPSSLVGMASSVGDDSPDSGASHNPEPWSSEQSHQRFPGWLRLAIIGGGALLSWGAVAVILAFLR